MKQQNVGQDCNILLHVLGSEIQTAKISTLKELGGLSQGNTTLYNAFWKRCTKSQGYTYGLFVALVESGILFALPLGGLLYFRGALPMQDYLYFMVMSIREQSPDALAEKMAIVFQDVYLLHDTIANNIRVGKPGARMEEIIAAAKAAQCHEFISALPDGYETMVGEGGNTLSGGEKQRISIARALIKNAPIVLLDETTSSLDADNEKEIHKALDALMKDKTVIVIAHRLNTIIGADQILVLDKGIISERGNHKELLAQNGWYARMISEQTKAREWSIT